jgi:hypothetical protein
MLVTSSGQTPDVIDTEPGVRADLLPVALPLTVRARDREKLFRVRPRSLSKLARQARQPALVLHMEKKLCRAIGVGSDDHLLRGVGVTVEMRRPLRPTWMTCVHLEAASIERDEVMDLVQLMDLDAELFRQVEIVGRQRVLGVAATADVAFAARDASGAPRSDPAEVRVVRLDAGATEIDAHRGLVERLPSSHLDPDLLHDPIDVGGHVRIANGAEHPGCLIQMRRQFVGPVGDVRPFPGVEEPLGRDIQRVGVDVRAAAHACATEDEYIVEILDPLDPVQLRGGEPQEVR